MAEQKSWVRRAGRVLIAGAFAGATLLGVAAPAIAEGTVPALTQARYTNEEASALVNPVVQEYNVDPSGAAWSFDASTRLVVVASDANTSNERLAEVVKLVNSEFAEKNVVSSDPFGMVYAPADMAGTADVVIDLASTVTDQSSSDEAYTIEISTSGVRVTAASENAVMYALRTLECLAQTTDNALPCGTIVDWPDLQERRLFVDCGRKYFSKDWFIRQIHEMSYMKLNTMDMHFSENLGFRIECDTDPAIVSDEYLTKDEVLEILEEARLYGINVIPSIDSPGHVDQILRAHPEYGQIANDGVTHYASGLDVTNEEAVAYMYSIYQEYIDLFKQGGATTDISIGCDEYMEFDRAPFTTMYQSVLTDWAHENLGSNYSWTDTLATYINNLADFCRENGLEPRVFNDGLYYGEGSSYQQKVKIDPTLGVDFWSQMSWNRSIANLQDLVNRGMEVFYNFNANYGYFVLRNDSRGASFDYDNNLEMWFDEWRPGDFQDAQNANVLADDDPRIKGTAIAIWCDYPDVATEDEVTEGIADSLRAMATRSWNVDSNQGLTLDEFMDLAETLGHAAAWEKGSKLPDAGEILPAENVGKVTVHYVDAEGNPVADDTVSYGTIGDAYEVSATDVYGYRLVSDEATVSGTFAKEDAEVTFVYELYTDKAELADALAQAIPATQLIDQTSADYLDALEAARAVYEDPAATQAQVDEVLLALTSGRAGAVRLENYGLYAEVTYPLPASDYVSGYDAYEQALDAARALIADAGSTTSEERVAALAAIRDAKQGLTKPVSTTPTVSATDQWYPYDGGFPYENMLDGNPNTKCWFNQNQEVGKEVVFTFPTQVMLSGISVSQPSGVGADQLAGADVQVAGADGTWVTVGHIDDSKLDWSFSFEKQAVSKARLVLTAEKPNWYQISEVSFAAEPVEEDTTLSDLIARAEDLSVEGKSVSLVKDLASALLDAQQAYVSAGDTEAAVEALTAAIAELAGEIAPTIQKDALEAFVAQADALDEKNFTAESWAALEEALSGARAALADEAATQAQVDDALVALQGAYYALEASDGTEEPEPATYTVTFDDLLATTENVTVTVEEGQTVDPALVPDPVCEGYVFEGWFTDVDRTVPFDFAVPVTSDLTVYAKWTEVDPGEEPGDGEEQPGGEEPGGDRPGGGTEQPGGGTPTTPGTGSGAGSGSGAQKPGAVPETGDPSTLAGAALAGAGALASLAGAASLRRRTR